MSARGFSERDIHMALDGELPDDERAAFEVWLDANPDMKARSIRYSADAEALRAAFAGVLEEPVPSGMVGMVVGGAPVRPGWPRSRWWLAAAAVVLLAVGGAGGYLAGSSGSAVVEAADDRLAEEAIAAHVVYAAEKRHAVEVPASDLDHMQTWLSNRVGLQLVAPDLTDDGFELVGGRLLPAGGSRAALLLYEDGQGNRVSLFVTAESAASGKGVYAQGNGGPRAIYWLANGYGCALVGSLPGERLDALATSAWRQLLSGVNS
jgi:anti-sigma factor RsiW